MGEDRGTQGNKGYPEIQVKWISDCATSCIFFSTSHSSSVGNQPETYSLLRIDYWWQGIPNLLWDWWGTGELYQNTKKRKGIPRKWLTRVTKRGERPNNLTLQLTNLQRCSTTSMLKGCGWLADTVCELKTALSKAACSFSDISIRG